MWVILLIAAIHGLVYIFLIPPWEHNDEPGHFEYASLIANLGRLPSRGEFDQKIRREIASSMIETGFTSRREINVAELGLLSLEDKVWISIEQVGREPIYYWLISWPLRLVKHTDVVVQVRLVRILSVLFLLLTVSFGFLIATDLFTDRILKMIVPLTLALLPGFVHRMTAINNDVLAVFVYSVFLWLCIRTIQRGISLVYIIGLVSIMIACIYTKRTVWNALLFGPLAILISLLRRYPYFLWILVLVLAGGIAISQFQWGKSSPSLFYYWNNVSPSFRIRSNSAVEGEFVLMMDNGSEALYQVYSYPTLEDYMGKEVTIGGWFWADKQTTIRLQYLITDDKGTISSYDYDIGLGSSPELYWYTATLPLEGRIARLVISRGLNTDVNASVYADCLFLITGGIEHDQDQVSPIPLSPNCNLIQWGHKSYINLIKNSSFERGVPILSSSLGKIVDRYFGLSVSIILGFLDYDAQYIYFIPTINNIFSTFWWKFGWANVQLVGNNLVYSYLFFFLFLISLVGSVAKLIKRRSNLDWDVLFFLTFVSISVIIMTIYRAATNLIQYTFTPSARYLLPVIIPISIFLSVGWRFWLSVLVRNDIPKLYLSVFIYMILFVVYDIFSAYSIWFYFINN